MTMDEYEEDAYWRRINHREEIEQRIREWASLAQHRLRQDDEVLDRAYALWQSNLTDRDPLSDEQLIVAVLKHTPPIL